MSSIHPFNLYKLFLSIKLHMGTEKFIHNKTILNNIKYSNFYNTKNHTRFEILSKKESLESSEELFVANIINDPTCNIHNIDSIDGLNVRHQWIKRIKNIGIIFKKEFKEFINEFNINNFDDLYFKMLNVPKNILTKINNISNIINIPFNEKNLFYTYFVSKLSPESAVILNYIYKKKYKINMLKQGIENKLEPKISFIKLYKYEHFLDMDKIINRYKSVTDLYKMI